MRRKETVLITLPESVEGKVEAGVIRISGAKGILERKIHPLIKIDIDGKEIKVRRMDDSKEARSLLGTHRAHILNMIKGVEDGWEKVMELVGAGFKAELQGRDLILSVGFSHPIKVFAPEGIIFSIEKSLLRIEGADKEKVHFMAAKIRSYHPPDPYKGKGLRYKDEVVKNKPGKQAVKGEGI